MSGYCIYQLGKLHNGQIGIRHADGEHKTACETEYTWAPSIDKYAVEYVLAYCAKRATEKGNTVLDLKLLSIELSVPNPPTGFSWSHELAKNTMHKSN